jgi:hypothetical protein
VKLEKSYELLESMKVAMNLREQAREFNNIYFEKYREQEEKVKKIVERSNKAFDIIGTLTGHMDEQLAAMRKMEEKIKALEAEVGEKKRKTQKIRQTVGGNSSGKFMLVNSLFACTMARKLSNFPLQVSTSTCLDNRNTTQHRQLPSTANITISLS